VPRRWLAGVALIAALIVGIAVGGTRASRADAAPGANAPDVSLDFAYFPYHDTIRARIDAGRFAEKSHVSGVVLSLQREGGHGALAVISMPPLVRFSTELLWQIPPLGEGNYELVANLVGVESEPVVAKFVRHVFPWERNRLGRSDTIVPGFEPIVVEGETVKTGLRKHELTKIGLWSQVTSLGTPLLARPMRLEIRRAGRTFVAGASELEIVDRTPTHVAARSRWTAGDVGGATTSIWDYDGLMKWTLELEPSGGTIDSMTLVVPVDEKLAPLLHVCSDGIRINYAGATPPGTGRIWQGGEALKTSMTGSFVPYLWVGAEERGIAVFADNDRGWVTDDGQPEEELVRVGRELQIRWNLVARLTKLDAERTITIGFQATPIKPMPSGWRTWTVSTYGRLPGTQTNFEFLGSSWYWGALTAAADMYPRGEDFSLFDRLAETRRTGRIDQTFVDSWLSGYPEVDEGSRRAYPPHIRYSFQAMTTAPDRVLIYTNPRGVRFGSREGSTFIDEWDRSPFPVRAKDSGQVVSYDVIPVESFRDYALWYYERMVGTFADDIYWDNVYLPGDFDTVTQGAFVRANGRIQPSVALYEVRELIRRTATLGAERGRPLRNMVHMTNTAIAPLLSFASTQLTWEDRVNEHDFQDRFSRDYVRAESIGRQYGNVPFALALTKEGDDRKRAWARRTAAGVMLTHEIKPIEGPFDDYWKNYERLLAFGYGGETVQVMNYWTPSYPLRIRGSDTASLLLLKPKSALVVVCDYGDGGALEVDLGALRSRLGARVHARNLETGEDLSVGHDGRVHLRLAKHDFALVSLD
jgi:hypothetical protein